MTPHSFVCPSNSGWNFNKIIYSRIPFIWHQQDQTGAGFIIIIIIIFIFLISYYRMTQDVEIVHKSIYKSVVIQLSIITIIKSNNYTIK